MNVRKSILIHLILWLLLFLLAVVFGASYLGFDYFFPKVTVFLGLALSIFYINYSFLIPRYYDKKQYVRYLLLSLITLTLVSWLRYSFEEMIIGKEPAYVPHNQVLVFLRYFISSFFVYGLALVLSLVEAWRKQENEIYKWKVLKNETDIKFLKNQLRPHFLFNSINNIYSIAVDNDDKSAPLLLEISQLLRYLIYKTDQDRIPINEEVLFLNAVIKLYSLGFETAPLKEIDVQGSIQKHQIPPFLLLPFIENIFKHGDFEASNKKWVAKLALNKNMLQFETQNPILENENGKEASSGVGLDILKQRLDILFPNAHELQMKEENRNYYVLLTIQLDN